MKDRAWQSITDSVNAIGRAKRTVVEVEGNIIIKTCIPSSNKCFFIKIENCWTDPEALTR